MGGQIDEQLKAKGTELPNASTPAANYVPFTRTGNLVYVSGQVSQWNGERKFIGKLGAEFGVAEGQQAARLCALNLEAHAKEAGLRTVLVSGVIEELWPERIPARAAIADRQVRWAHEVEGLLRVGQPVVAA